MRSFEHLHEQIRDGDHHVNPSEVWSALCEAVLEVRRLDGRVVGLINQVSAEVEKRRAAQRKLDISELEAHCLAGTLLDVSEAARNLADLIEAGESNDLEIAIVLGTLSEVIPPIAKRRAE